MLSEELDAIRCLPPIGLADLVDTADLQTRKDRKYLLPTSSAGEALAGLRARALDIGGLRSFRYESIYFDTSEWDSYLHAARRRPRRFKVRTRAYLDSGECMLEVKVRDGRGNTVKHRRPHDIAMRRSLTPGGIAFVRGIEASAPYVDALHPVLTVSYRRSTLALDGADARITIDRDAAWFRAGVPGLTLGDRVLVETKTTGPPCEVDRLLWRRGHRPLSISKFATGLAALETQLPSNRWHRVLQRHILSDHDGDEDSGTPTTSRGPSAGAA